MKTTNVKKTALLTVPSVKTAFPWALGALLLLAASHASAIVNTDPALTFGSGSLAQSNGGLVPINRIASGSTSAGELEAVNGFGVIKSGFAGFERYNNGSVKNGFAFTDPNRPDVRFSFSGSSVNADSGLAMTNLGYLSTATGMRVYGGGNAGNVVTTIEFGSYAEDAFSVGDGVSAAGFVLSGPNGLWPRVTSVTSVFLSTSGDILSTQSINPAGTYTGSNGVYFGYAAGSNELIGSIVLTVEFTASPGNTLPLSLNNFGFAPAAIPEPAHVTLILGVGAVAVLAFSRRICRKRK